MSLTICDNKFRPVNKQSDDILKKREFALIGISPFNSYFSVENIYSILQIVNRVFDDFAIFIPDKISRFTLKALGYDDQRIHHKIRKQDNYLKNKVIKALEQLNQFQKDKIITLSSIIDNPKYIETYNLCLKLFDNDDGFKRGCMQTSSWVLSSYERSNNFAIDNNMCEIAVQYFISELPMFLSASEILRVNSCSFIYHSIPDFLKTIYANYNLASKVQGFVVMDDISNQRDANAA